MSYLLWFKEHDRTLRDTSNVNPTGDFVYSGDSSDVPSPKDPNYNPVADLVLDGGASTELKRERRHFIRKKYGGGGYGGGGG